MQIARNYISRRLTVSSCQVEESNQTIDETRAAHYHKISDLKINDGWVVVIDCRNLFVWVLLRCWKIGPLFSFPVILLRMFPRWFNLKNQTVFKPVKSGKPAKKNVEKFTADCDQNNFYYKYQKL